MSCEKALLVKHFKSGASQFVTALRGALRGTQHTGGYYMEVNWVAVTSQQGWHKLPSMMADVKVADLVPNYAEVLM